MLARQFSFVYVPSCYEPEYDEHGRFRALRPLRAGIAELIKPAILDDFDAFPLPRSPIVPLVECVQDRIAIEIMRGCPWRCRFCQSTTIKRPLRFRRIETIIAAAEEACRTTGYNEISLLSLSTSDYPQFDELIRRMKETFDPRGVSISVPSLRVNEQLRHPRRAARYGASFRSDVRPEVALDDMRQQIGKPIKNEDLFEGCRKAFENGFQRIKLYFLCGLPGERPADLDGILDMAETIARIGKEIRGRAATVVANVSNFVPKPHTPYQWNGMQGREYFIEAHQRLRRRRTLRSVEIKCHDVDSSMLEGVMARGDRRLGAAIERAWRTARGSIPGGTGHNRKSGGRRWPKAESTCNPCFINPGRWTRGCPGITSPSVRAATIWNASRRDPKTNWPSWRTCSDHAPLSIAGHRHRRHAGEQP